LSTITDNSYTQTDIETDCALAQQETHKTGCGQRHGNWGARDPNGAPEIYLGSNVAF